MAKTASSGAGSVELVEGTVANGARRIRSRRRRRDRAAVPVLPDELVLWEILVRLPAKELFRCRAACRSWRRVTSDLAFLLAHQRHQPSLSLVQFEAHNSAQEAVDAFDLRRSPAVRRPLIGFNDGHRSYPSRYYSIEASCDGLLLLSSSSDGCLHLCNPATRQWLTLRNLSFSNVAALYPHRPSGEYRILYWKHTSIIDFESIVYHVLTVGSSQGQERCIDLPVLSPSMKNHTACWLIYSCVSRSVLLHDCLHWYNNDKIIVFDTVSETFRWMQSPTTTTTTSWETHVLQMDGTLGVAHVDLDAMNVVVWVLQDYEKQIWSTKYRIKLPDEEMRKVVAGGHFIEGAVVSENGDTLLIDGNFSSRTRTMFHCDGKGKLVQKFPCENVEPDLLPLRFKESLVRHAFFNNNRKQNGRRVRMPRFLRGLYY